MASEEKKAESNAVENEGDSVADMEMSTSPTISPSTTPTLPASDTLPNVNVAVPPSILLHPGSWFLGPGALMSVPLDEWYRQYECLTAVNAASAEGASISSLTNTRQKETIRLQNAVMYPPNPNAPLPPVRDRPPGCRTVFVGGLPEKCTEEILRELLERCGEIQNIRMSKKNFAHVRFVDHDSADRALYFSGYRMKVEDRSDKEYTGRIHVDYAQARDDMHEWEKEKRVLEREQRRDRSSSPGTSTHFSESEATALLEKLKDSDTFTEASQLLLNWLDKGECSKKTATIFYSMIAAVNAHVRRLHHDRRQYEAELREFREKHNQKLQGVMTQFCQIEKVFRLARKQKNWDHFSRAQRKNVDTWLTHAEAIRKANEEAMLRDRYEEEMETSDSDEDEGSKDDQGADESFLPVHKKAKIESVEPQQKRLEELMEENARLKDQLEGMKKDKESQPILKASSSSPEMESRFVALLSCFLNVHPLGATVDYMWAYLRQLIPTVRAADIENVLETYPHLFKLESSGVGATYERKWVFIGFQS